MDRVGDLADDRGALAELERGGHAAELEAVDVLHDDHRRPGVGSDFEDLDDARIGEERERPRFVQKRRQPGAIRPRRAVLTRPCRRRCA